MHLGNNLRKAAAILVMAACLPLTSGAQYKDGYYNAMDGKKEAALKNAAKACVQKHTRLEYYPLPNNWVYTDVYPERYNGDRRWWEMYSNEVYLILGNQSGTSSFSANHMQREHAVPKSWWKKNGDVEYTPAYTDLWNLYPSDAAANQAKSNYPFAEVGNTNVADGYDNGLTKVGTPKDGLGGGCPMAFEPGDEYKGDFARAIFYMATVYDDLTWAYKYMFNSNQYPTLRPWASEMLLQWARQDPVSQKERDRNNAVETQQGNRNPFIDFPELAEYIWGTRTKEIFLIAEQGSLVTPPITGDPEITAPLNGEALDFGQAAVGSTISRELEIRGANLTAPLSVSLSGKDRKMFTLTQTTIPAININATDVYRLQVLYTPTTTGVHQAAAVLFDGGLPDGQSIAVMFEAEGVEPPVLTRLTATEPTDVSANGYTANWTAAPETVDYYELTRTRYLADGEETELLESDTNTLAIAGRDPEVAESYSVCSVRLGFRSEKSNSIIINAESGINNLGFEGTTRIMAEKQGYRLETVLEKAEVSVYDLNGLLVERNSYANGDLLPNYPGRFLILKAEGMATPVKLTPRR